MIGTDSSITWEHSRSKQVPVAIDLQRDPVDRCRASQRLWEPGRITRSQRPGYGGYGTSFSSPAQSHGIGTGWQPTYSQTPQWTGTQRGEGQSGMGPSSLAQGVSWGDQPSWTQGGTVGTGWQPTYSQTPQWRGTQYGEGQSGMGPSSLAQGASWGGQPSWMQGGTGTGTGWQPAYSQATQWTGTQYGEGQSGMGPSSLAQWARWGGQPSWIQSQPGTQGQWR